MYVVDGDGSSIEANRRAVHGVYELATSTGESVVWVWIPRRQVAFGPRDVRHPGYADAADAADQMGYRPVHRSVGGHPVAHTGSTLAFVRVTPIDDPRRGLQRRYDDAIEAIARAMSDLGVDVDFGEPPGAFCPGDHSLSAGGKIVGLAQRVTSEIAATSGIAIISGESTVAEVLTPVYDALELPFDPSSVGSLEAAGGPDDLDIAARAVARALRDGESPRPIAFERVSHPDEAV